jgi:hypothetical protein
MRVPAEVSLSSALVLAATAGYVAVARGGPPAASGLVGHGLGVVGFLLMAAGTAGYAWRKRRNGPGSMQRWLQAHVVSGIVGPYLVLLHTGFAFRGVAGVSFVLVAVVVISGVVGRFAYIAVPKPPPGYATDVMRRWDAAAEQLGVRHRTPALVANAAAASRGDRVRAEPHLLARRAHAAERKRRVLAPWWLLHVPLAFAMFVLALVHVLGALYYATLLR